MNLEEINSEEFKNIIVNLINATSPADLLVGSFKNFISDNRFRAIISLNDYHKEVDPNKMSLLVGKYSMYLTSFFLTSKLYFLDRETLIKMHKGGEVKIGIDFSVMFDSNFASYIYNFVNNIELKDVTNDFYVIVDEIIKDKWNFDYLFYIYENYKNIRHLKNIEESKAYQCIIENLTALELFKSIDENEYIKSGKVKYLITKEKARDKAKEILISTYSDEIYRKFLDMLYHTKQMILLTLIGMIRIRFENKSNYQNKMIQYFNFVSENIGINLERETFVAYEYFRNPNNVG